LKVELGFPSVGGPLNSTGAGLLNQQNPKIAEMEVDLETFAEEEEEDTIELGEV
jgi:hypothetical protein